MKEGQYLVGVDIGGTFTDLVAIDVENNRLLILKTPSTPDDFAKGTIQAIQEAGILPSDIKRFIHGTTVATNAVIQRKGANVTLITTQGFRDILEIRRTTRGELYNVQWDPPVPLIPRMLRLEIKERTSALGQVLLEVNPSEIEGKIRELVNNNGLQAVAVAFLNSYINPSNELKLKKYLQRCFPDLFVVTSSEIMPEWREFERTSTTCVGAFVGPVLSDYLLRLDGDLKVMGCKSDVLLMLSNGGLATAGNLNRIAPQTILSGPAAGVVAVSEFCKVLGQKNVIAIDMGGTSTDVSIIRGGRIVVGDELEIEFGTVVHLPVVDISTIGAGGGSIAWVDSGGVLRVGPQSAGASPGPACYKKGGVEPTTTDANVVLKRLNPEYILGGKLKIDRELSMRIVKEKVASHFGLDIFSAAQGIIEITNNNIANAIRQKTIQKGLDPREFVLFAFGGAGPLHASEVARILGIPTIIVPPNPGVTSATGLLLADIRHDYVSTFLEFVDDVDLLKLQKVFSTMEGRALKQMIADGVFEDSFTIARSIDARYAGQTHELNVEFTSDVVDNEAIEEFKVSFQKKHMMEYGYSRDLNYPMELVNVRVAATASVDKPKWVPMKKIFGMPEPYSEREVYFKELGGFVPTNIFQRRDLRFGHKFRGPAVIEQYDSTVLILSGQSCEIDPFGNLIIRE